jgi:hypothetical protein
MRPTTILLALAPYLALLPTCEQSICLAPMVQQHLRCMETGALLLTREGCVWPKFLQPLLVLRGGSDVDSASVPEFSESGGLRALGLREEGSRGATGREWAARLSALGGRGNGQRDGLEKEMRKRADEKIQQWRNQAGDDEAERAEVERMVIESSVEPPDDGSELIAEVLLARTLRISIITNASGTT